MSLYSLHEKYFEPFAAEQIGGARKRAPDR
jgi:hypothetical protein